MAVDLVLREYPELLTAYLESGGQACVIVTDAAGHIEACNEAFRRALQTDVDFTGLGLDEILGRGDWQRLVGERRGGEAGAMAGRFPYRRVTVAPRPDRYAARPLLLLVFDAGDRWILFGERVESDENDIVARLSVLTSEMADLNRELSKANASLERANATITRLMNSDPLTGIANRRFFSEMLVQALSFARRHGRPLALTICDIDRFKQINDAHGHAAGDAVLVAYAHLLRESCRTEDVPARFGGDESCVLLPATDLAQGLGFIERLRDGWSTTTTEDVPDPVTASFGLAVAAPEDGPEYLLRRADEALYEAKRGGRDRVATARRRIPAGPDPGGGADIGAGRMAERDQVAALSRQMRRRAATGLSRLRLSRHPGARVWP